MNEDNQDDCNTLGMKTEGLGVLLPLVKGGQLRVCKTEYFSVWSPHLALMSCNLHSSLFRGTCSVFCVKQNFKGETMQPDLLKRCHIYTLVLPDNDVTVLPVTLFHFFSNIETSVSAQLKYTLFYCC